MHAYIPHYIEGKLLHFVNFRYFFYYDELMMIDVLLLAMVLI